MIVRSIKSGIRYIFLSIVAFVSIFPFAWMIIGATNSASDITKGKFSFGGEFINNWHILVGPDGIDLAQLIFNSAKIAIVGMFLQLFVASMAGYGFEIFRNKISDKVYSVLLLTMMVPFAALMIPLFKLFAGIDMLDNHFAVILPTLATPFMIFFFRQNTKTFPHELLQAARVDGLNEFQAFFRIYVPTMKSTYAAAAILSFMTFWNSYLWPLIVIQSDPQKTLILGISSMSSAYFPQYGAIMIAIIIATAPTLLIFFLLQRHFVAGMLGSIK